MGQLTATLTDVIIAAADGSSLSNPGPAGWAWYIDDRTWAAGGWKHGTNNMGELMAVLDLLQSTSHLDEPLRILCDSQYVINSLTKWLPSWKRRGWKKGDGKPVMNVDLMKDLDKALAGRDVTFEWVKGHAGHDLNEAADDRARAAAAAFRDGVTPDTGPGYPKGAPTARAVQFATKSVAEDDTLFDFDVVQAAAEAGAAAEAANRSVLEVFFDLEDVPEGEWVTPGVASHRIKAALIEAMRRLASLAAQGERYDYLHLVHPSYLGHSPDGRVVFDGDDGWRPLPSDFRILSIDAYGTNVAGVTWESKAAPAVLGYALWHRVPEGWQLRFTKETPIL